MSRENVVVQSCITALNAANIPHFRNNTGAHAVPETAKHARRFIAYGAKGWPDIVAILPGGKFLGVECKAPKEGTKPAGKLTDTQKEVGAMIERQGGVYLIVRNGQDLAEWIDKQITKS